MTNFFSVKLRSLLIGACIFAFMLLILFSPELSLGAARDALLLCATRIVPALFIFSTLTSMLIDSGFVALSSNFFAPCSKFIFGASPAAVFAFICGILGGYPIGAQVIARLYRENMLTKSESERLLGVCNNAGPVFVVSVVGYGCLGSLKLGLLLLAAHTLSAFLCAFIFGKLEGHEIKKTASPAFFRVPFAKSFCDSVKDSSAKMLGICGYICFFSVLSSVLSANGVFDTLSAILPFKKEISTSVLRGSLEISREIALLSTSEMGIYTQTLLCAFLLGFSGLCVMFQVLSAVDGCGFSIGKYIKIKIIEGLISVLLVYVMFLSFGQSVTVFSPKTVEIFADPVRQSSLLLIAISIYTLCVLITLISVSAICYAEEKKQMRAEKSQGK